MYTWTIGGVYTPRGAPRARRSKGCRSTSPTSSRASSSGSPSHPSSRACSSARASAHGRELGARAAGVAGRGHAARRRGARARALVAAGTLGAHVGGPARRVGRTAHVRPRPERDRASRPSSRTSRTHRTPTAASAKRAAEELGALLRVGRHGPRGGRRGPARGARATGTRCSTRCAAKHRRSKASATSSARSSRCTRAGCARARWEALKLEAKLLAGAPRGRLVRGAGEPDGVCDLRAARRGPPGRRLASCRRRRAGSRASRTPTAASASRRAGAAAKSTTRARPSRRSLRLARTRTPRSRARVSYITRAQNPDGGFPEGPGSESNAQSTAWAVQGLIAGGRDVDALKRDGGRSPLGYLRSLVSARRQRALLAHERADTGLGDRAGADRARAQALPRRPRAHASRRLARELLGGPPCGRPGGRRHPRPLAGAPRSRTRRQRTRDARRSRQWQRRRARSPGARPRRWARC